MNKKNQESIQVFQSSIATIVIQTILTVVLGFAFIYFFQIKEGKRFNVVGGIVVLAVLLFDFILNLTRRVVVTVDKDYLTVRKMFKPEVTYRRSDYTFKPATATRSNFVRTNYIRCLYLSGVKGEGEVLLPYFTAATHKQLGEALASASSPNPNGECPE